jgi:heat shock protein HslJ
MRVPRTLVAVAVFAAMLTSPTLTVAQAQVPARAAEPAALAPDGVLPLEGTPWRLTRYRWKGSERTPGPEVAAAMTLTAGRLRASGGCTAFEGTYGTVGSAITFDPDKLQQDDCAEQTTVVQLGMVEGLRKARSYRLQAGAAGDELILRSAAGIDVLRFGLDDIGRLAPADWHLQAFTIDGERQEVDPVAGPSLVFLPERRANEARRRSSGTALSSTGCNGFRAEYFARANVLSFLELEATDAPCPGPLLAQQEAVLSVFEATAIDVALPADRLILTSADSGDKLEYRSRPALEGATWILAPPQASPGVDEIVTIRLEDGVATGYGPCGPYSAAYATDGLFITFSDVAGAKEAACARPADERKLLAALRKAVRVDRDPGRNRSLPRLVLQDARGQRVAAFVPGSQGAP